MRTSCGSPTSMTSSCPTSTGYLRPCSTSGLNKATVAARRIAELDPYLPVELFDRGITTESVDGFLDGVDVLVEECDSLDMKVLIRQVGTRATASRC